MSIVEPDLETEIVEPGVTPADVRNNRIASFAIGAVMALLGVIAIIAAFAATVATVMVFGVLLGIAAAVQIAHAFRSVGHVFGLHLAAGILYAIVASMLIVDPIGGAIGLTLLLAVFFLFSGFLKVTLSIQPPRSAMMAFSGVLSLVLGGLILLGWPESGVWVIGLFVGLELLISGITLSVAASALPHDAAG